jgi:uncharacterized membrane protein YqhA
LRALHAVHQENSELRTAERSPANGRIEAPEPKPEVGAVETLVGRLVSNGHYLILLAIVGSVLASGGVLVYAWLAGIAEAVDDVSHSGLDPDGVKKVSVEIISLVDLFLLGTVLYVVSVGLYQLFVDPQLPTPRWLKISDLDDLKERLLGTVVVLLAVSFLGYVVTWDGTFNLLGVGGAIGIVMVAISLLLGRFHRPRE